MEKYQILLPDDQVGFMLSQAYLLKQRVTNSALKELDITYPQFVILATILVLQNNKGWITQQTIADKRRMDKVTVSNTVKTLVQRGLIKRNHHPEDQRAFILRLTPRGTEAAIRGKQIVTEADQLFFANIDNEQLGRILKQLLIDNEESNANTYK